MALLLKIVLVPLLLWGLTVVGRIFGPKVAGMSAGIPVVAGPLMVFIATEQGPVFSSHSARFSLAAEGALVTFCLAYALAARHWIWWKCLLLGWAAFLASTAVLNRFNLSIAECLAIGLSAPLVLRYSLPSPPKSSAEAPRVPASSDVIWRMLAGAALVLILTALAQGLGPRLSGLLTPFPVATAVLAAFSHRAHGAAFSVDLMRGLGFGMYSFTAFFSVVALGIKSMGLAPAFGTALLASVVVQGLLLTVMTVIRRGADNAPASARTQHKS